MAVPEGVDLRELNQVQIAEVQSMLRRAGYDTGPVDGLLGPRTWEAWARFLTRNGIEPRLTTVPQFVSGLSASTAPEVWGRVVLGGELQSPVAGPPTVTPAGVPSAAGTPGAPPVLPATNVTPVELSAEKEADLRKRYPDMAYLLDTNPEVRNILAKAVESNPPWSTEETRAAIMQTTWYRNTSYSMRMWDDEMARDPAQAMAKWQQRKLVVLGKAQQLGIAFSDNDAEWVSGRVLREGWSDEQLNRFLAGVVRNNPNINPGTLTGDQTKLKALARSYMSMLSDKDALEYATRIFEGSLSMEGVTTMFKDQAKNRFSWLSNQIDSGLTPDELFQSNRNAVADILEVDADTIDLNDPRWSELTSPIMENGQTRAMNFYEAQIWARKKPEWRMTANANREASQMTMNLLKIMGAMG